MVFREVYADKLPLKAAMSRVVDGFQFATYRLGPMRYISVCLELDAACWANPTLASYTAKLGDEVLGKLYRNAVSAQKAIVIAHKAALRQTARK